MEVQQGQQQDALLGQQTGCRGQPWIRDFLLSCFVALVPMAVSGILEYLGVIGFLLAVTIVVGTSLAVVVAMVVWWCYQKGVIGFLLAVTIVVGTSLALVIAIVVLSLHQEGVINVPLAVTIPIVAIFVALVVGMVALWCHQKDLSSVDGKWVKAVAEVLKKDDPLKFIAILYEMQKPHLVVNVSSECKFNEFKPTEMIAFSWVLRQAMCLVTKLDLSACILNANLVNKLSAGLVENASIQNLNLSGCHIPANAMVTLAAGIKTLTALKYLKLSWNDVSPAAAERLAESLESLKRLEILDLIQCHIQDSGATEIVAAVKNSKSLTIHFGNNHITPNVCTELGHLGMMNGLDVVLYDQFSPPNDSSNVDCARVGCKPW